jgi:hypothetical protein
MTNRAVLLALMLFLVACDRPDQPSSHPAIQPSGRGGAAVVDSIFPIEEEIRRFQDSLPPVTVFSGGAASRDELVRRFVTALERADTSAFLPLVLDQSEFGWLYFPESRYTVKPYKTKPGLVWFQIQNVSNRGIGRSLARLGGSPIGFRSYSCGGEPVVEGKNTLWEGCTVTYRPTPADSTRTLRLFGSIIERGGTYKFIGLGNDF